MCGLQVPLIHAPEAVIFFKDAEEAGGKDFLKVLLINTLAQTYARHTRKLSTLAKNTIWRTAPLPSAESADLLLRTGLNEVSSRMTDL